MALTNGKMLCRDLNEVEMAYLSNLCQHPGFKVIVKMMEEACENATREVIQLDPVNTDDYEHKLAILQLTARATNSFCSSFLKSVEVHANRAFADEQEKEAEAIMLARFAALKQETQSE